MRDSIAHFTIISQIGSGGMGEVFLASDGKLDRQVALKILRADAAGDEDRIRRFIREAKAASALNHPNILTVYEIGTFDDSHYIATELIKGDTLRNRLRAENLTLRETLDIATQTAAALNAAHEAHIVHRDIKPENIMLRDDGLVKVLDFGLAKLAEPKSAGSGSEDATMEQVNTAPGVVMGTVNYMSPEQTRGKETDARTDIWSLGAVIYEMLAGRSPFAGETPNDSIAAILTKEPESLPDVVPFELRRIVKKSLQKKADERYQTVKDFLLDLKDLKRELEFPERSYTSGSTGPVNPRTGQMDQNATAILDGRISKETSAAPTQVSGGEMLTSTISRHKMGAAFTLAAAAIVLSGFVYGVYVFIEKPRVGQAKTATEVKTQRLTGDGKAYYSEISPDGKFLAYVKLEGDEQALWIKQIQTNSAVPIVKPGQLNLITGIMFSPDGGFVYFNAYSGNIAAPTVYRVPTLGGAPTRILTNANMPQFSPAGDQISFLRTDLNANEGGVFVANADGSNERKILSRSGTESVLISPAWSPNGKYIAIGYRDSSLEPNPSASIKLISVADGSQSDLGSYRWNAIDDVVWHPSGDSLIVVGGDRPFGGSQLWEVSYPSGAVRRLTNNPNGYYTISITSDGRSIVTSEKYSRSAIWVSPDLKPENAKQVMPFTGDTWGLSWTPDHRIVFASDQTGDNEIWIMDADGSNAKPLTNDHVFKTIPVVSPDGRYIVYISAAHGGQMERIDIDGGNPLAFNGIVSPDGPDISSDGKWIIYDSLAEGVSKIFRVPIGGGEPQQLIDLRGTKPRYSSDGTRFACFLSDETTQNWTKLAIFRAAGGEPLKVFDIAPGTEVHRGPVWTPDDSGITLIVAQGGKFNLWLQSLNGGPPKQTTNFDLPVLYRRQYSRDGKRVAIVRGEGIGNAIMITDFR